MLSELLSILWLFLPAGLANASPVFAARLNILKRLNRPADFNKTFGGIRLLGDHKTIRGLVVASLVGICVCSIQYLLYKNTSFGSISLVDYSKLNPLILGFLLGFGAISGDAIKSFFKRRFKKRSGESWFPFDQLDYIIGGLFFSYPYISAYLVKPLPLIGIFVVWFGLHILSTNVGFLLKLKDKPI